MSELRWILSLLGVVFVVGLFLWERRKQRPRERAVESKAPAPGDEAADWHVDRAHEAPLTLPEIRAREPVQPLPVIELPEDDAHFDIDFVPDASPAHRGASAAEAAVAASAAGSSVGFDDDDHDDDHDDDRDHGDDAERIEPHQGDRLPASRIEPTWDDAAVIATDKTPAAPGVTPAPAMPAARIEPFARPDPSALRLEWADEPERRIIAIRVVPIIERFGGRTVRQALAGEGFLHGPLGIFHRALADGRVVLSCASLTKPGGFDLATMDSQRYAGLNLFGVLPGPLSAAATLEDLVTVSRTLASRLGGLLQDERGQPLDATRIAELREQVAPNGALSSRPPSPPAGAGANASS